MSLIQLSENIDNIRFSRFSFNYKTMILSDPDGVKILPPKPSQILNLLLLNPGKVISREEIIQHVWAEQVVDFDQNINFCIKQIRQLLSDDSKNPQFIETLPKKGYRFIAKYSYKNNQAEPSDDKLTLKYPKLLSGSILSVVLLITLWYSMQYLFNSEEKQLLSGSETEQTIKRGFYLYEKGAEGEFNRAQQLFEKAISMEPLSADAHAGLALVKLYAVTDDSSRAIVRNHGTQAIELSANSAYANLAMAKISLYLDWDIATAQQYFNVALQKQPDSIAVLHDLAVVATIEGNFELARESIEKALDIDPGRFQEQYHAGWFYQAVQQYDIALKQCIQSLEIASTHAFSLLCAGRSAIKLGLTQTAGHYIGIFMQLAKAEPKITASISDDIEKGDSTSFNQWYLTWLQQHKADAFQLALAYGDMGDTDKALQALTKAIEQKHMMVPTAWAFDELQNTRQDPRFSQLMKVVTR